MSRFAAIRSDAAPFAPAPRWLAAIDAPPEKTLQDSAFFAGAALALLDQVVRREPPWLSALRQRQALAAAAALARLLCYREDEPSLRDAEHLTKPHQDPGPAGRMHRAWRWLAAGQRALDDDTIGRLASALDLTIDARRLAEEMRTITRTASTPILAAAAAARAISDALDSAAGDALALMSADIVLAERLRWSACLPLLATCRLTLRNAARPEWPHQCHAACARAALAAHRSALDLARRAERFVEASAKVRTKGRDAGVAAIMADDAVAPAALTGLGSDRAARRFLDRLTELGAIRELTGRPVSRLYGL